MKNLLYLLLIFLFFSCTPIYVPALFQDSDFSSTIIDEPIFLMPILDLRVDKSKNLNLDDNVKRVLSSKFSKNGYGELIQIKDKRYSESIVEDDLIEPDSVMLSTLGPQNANYLFIPVLHDFKSKLTFGSTANAEISGYIIDKKRGKIVWKHKGIGQAGQGGLIGMAMISVIMEEAVSSALYNLSLALPKNPKVSENSVYRSNYQ